MKIRKVKKDEIANLRDELYMSMFWLGMGVVWLPGPELRRSLLVSAQEFVSVMFMIFIYTLDENIKIGGWLAYKYAPTNSSTSMKHLFYFSLVFFQT